MLALLVLGLALVAFGALVLLRFPDRPGGEVRLMGLRVSSIGAGLPRTSRRCRRSLLSASERCPWRSMTSRYWPPRSPSARSSGSSPPIAAGANPSSVDNVSHLRARFGADLYDIELKPNSTEMEMELHVVRP